MRVRSGRVCLALLALFAGCIEPDLLICADGTACIDKVCDPVHGGCVAPDQLTVCDGLGSDEPCHTSDVNGACFDGVCLATGCGNNIVEPNLGEQCDPPSDTCSADCKSNLSCGNGVIDLALGEQCDDGNLRNHDGCDSRCRLETLGYTIEPLGPLTTSPSSGVMDQAHGVFIHYDGTSTWGWDGTRWSLLAPAGPGGGTLVYDPDLGRVLLIGSAAVYDWNGTTWEQLIASTQPPGALMYYDPIAHDVVAVDDSPYVDKTSTLDLSTGIWTMTAIAFAGNPYIGDLVIPHAVYDAGRDVPMIVTGGGTVYEFHGIDWQQVGSSLPLISGLGGSANFVYDGDRAAVVAWAGCGESCDSDNDCTPVCTSAGYTWDGAQWNLIPDVTVDAPDGAEIGYDPISHTTFLEFAVASVTQAWLLDGVGWREVDHPAPAIGTGQTTTFDRGQVLYAGSGTWTFDGAWHPVSADSVTTMTGYGLTSVIAYDPVRDAVFAIDANLEQLVGTSWQSTGVPAPPDLARAMAFDPIGKRLVVVGYMATWALDSSTPLVSATWSQLAAPPLPYSFYYRGTGELAFDSLAGTLVWTEVESSSYSQVFELRDAGWVPAPSPGLEYMTVSWSSRASLMFVSTAAGTPIWERHDEILAPTSATIPLPFSGGLQDVPSLGKVVGLGSVGTFRAILTIGYQGPGLDETCDGTTDGDGDGLVGCDDPDCWWMCTPACPIGTSCD